MSMGRFALTVAAVWVVRTAMNATFYGVVMSGATAEVEAKFPGLVREVIPAYILADLLFAVLFVYLLSRVAGTLGGGAAAGIKLGFLIALLSPVLTNIYFHYSFTFTTASWTLSDMAAQTVFHMIEGAVAGALYRPAEAGAGATV